MPVSASSCKKGLVSVLLHLARDLSVWYVLLPLWLISLIPSCSALIPSLLLGLLAAYPFVQRRLWRPFSLLSVQLGRSLLAASLSSDQPGNPALADSSEYCAAALLFVVGGCGGLLLPFSSLQPVRAASIAVGYFCTEGLPELPFALY